MPRVFLLPMPFGLRTRAGNYPGVPIRGLAMASETYRVRDWCAENQQRLSEA
jgi:hypothetical protein